MFKKLLILSLILLISSCTKTSRSTTNEKSIPIYAQGFQVKTSSITADCYASPSGNNSNSGATVTLAKKDIQACINIVSNGQTVIAELGTYIENINFNGKNITVASEFINSGDPADIDNTIIDGNHAGSVVFIGAPANNGAVLKGFTIRNGGGNGAGGGIHVFNAAPILENLKVINNEQTSSSNGGGGGVFINYNLSIIPVILRNSEVTGNHSASVGGGLLIITSGPIQLSNIKIVGNSAANDGGGAFVVYGCYSDDLTLDRLYVTENQAGGIYLQANTGTNKKITIINSLIANNVAKGDSCPYTNADGGLKILLAPPSNNTSINIINSTIANNSNPDYGSGLYVSEYQGASLTNVNILNTIIWGNGSQTPIYVNMNSPVGTLNIANSDIQSLNSGGIMSNVTPNLIGTTNFDTDPQFISQTLPNINYSLLPNSPCIATGALSTTQLPPDPITAPTNDILDALRPAPNGTMPDVGAYEVAQKPTTPTIIHTTVPPFQRPHIRTILPHFTVHP